MTDTFFDVSPGIVAHQFEDAQQQRETSTLGMWAFLATEVLFFGVLFTSYTICRVRWPAAFREGSVDLKWYMGCVNTAVLLLSSFTMALAVRAAAMGRNGLVVRNLVLTMLFGCAFLGIKAAEYYLEYAEHLVPRLNFTTEPPAEGQTTGMVKHFKAFERRLHLAPAQSSGATRNPKEELFMLFYFIMTAFHATHMVIGIGVMAVMICLTRRGWFSAEYHNPIEMAGLYWHFVDIVWIFLFPVLYLLRNN